MGKTNKDNCMSRVPVLCFKRKQMVLSLMMHVKYLKPGTEAQHIA